MRHLRLANGHGPTGGVHRKIPTTDICYFIDQGTCFMVDMCGIDIADCWGTEDVCMVDE